MYQKITGQSFVNILLYIFRRIETPFVQRTIYICDILDLLYKLKATTIIVKML